VLQDGQNMRKQLLAPFVIAALMVPIYPVATSAAASEDLSRCGAVTLKERPELGQTDNWNHGPHVRRHNQYLRSHPKVFASGYLSGRHFYVGFTRNVCKNLHEFRKGLPQKWRVRAFQATFSYKRLRLAQRCVTAMMSNSELGISAVGADVYRNKTMVMLSENTEERRAVIRAECEAAKARILRFEEGTIEPQ
jgi:hypothetical protein